MSAVEARVTAAARRWLLPPFKRRRPAGARAAAASRLHRPGACQGTQGGQPALLQPASCRSLGAVLTRRWPPPCCLPLRSDMAAASWLRVLGGPGGPVTLLVLRSATQHGRARNRDFPRCPGSALTLAVAAHCPPATNQRHQSSPCCSTTTPATLDTHSGRHGGSSGAAPVADGGARLPGGAEQVCGVPALSHVGLRHLQPPRPPFHASAVPASLPGCGTGVPGMAGQRPRAPSARPTAHPPPPSRPAPAASRRRPAVVCRAQQRPEDPEPEVRPAVGAGGAGAPAVARSHCNSGRPAAPMHA